VERPAEVAELERVLLPGPGQRQRQKIRPAKPRRDGYVADSSADIDMGSEGRCCLACMHWLLIFDNVNRKYKAQGGDPDAYDVRRYLSGADHGLVLVTTRLARLEQLGV
jgi:hypothetical protein